MNRLERIKKGLEKLKEVQADIEANRKWPQESQLEEPTPELKQLIADLRRAQPLVLMSKIEISPIPDQEDMQLLIELAEQVHHYPYPSASQYCVCCGMERGLKHSPNCAIFRLFKQEE